MSRERGNAEELRRSLERGRAPTVGEVSQQGYADSAGVPRTVGGDDDAPWLKTPPFPSDVVRWLTVDSAVAADFDGDYVFTEPLDVTNVRQLTAWLAFAPTIAMGDATGLLSLVPQVARQLNEVNPPATEFYSIPVIDPQIAVLNLSGTVLAFNGFGSRTFRPAEFRSAAVATGEVLRVAFAFDVDQFVAFRLALGATLDQDVAASLAVDYSYAL